jgi:hypothetical protein
MAAYSVILHGCDDSLSLGVDLDNHDAALLQRIARMSEDIHSGCEPYMTVTETTGENPDE